MADRSARILLVDDEQSIQTPLSYPLRKEGYDVVQATDGRQALDRFDEQVFDVVVLDLMLPTVDGLEVCRRLRNRSSVPIIILTAKSEEIDKVVGLELGADDYITKPFSLREFSSRIKAALRRAEMVRPAETAYRDPRTIDVHIRHLREKLERDPKEPEYLFTVRGVGYRFRDTEPSARARNAARGRSAANQPLAGQPARPGVLRDHARRAGPAVPVRRTRSPDAPAEGSVGAPRERQPGPLEGDRGDRGKLGAAGDRAEPCQRGRAGHRRPSSSRSWPSTTRISSCA